MVISQQQLKAFGDDHFSSSRIASFRSLMFPSGSTHIGSSHSNESDTNAQPSWADYCSTCQTEIYHYYTSLGWIHKPHSTDSQSIKNGVSDTNEYCEQAILKVPPNSTFKKRRVQSEVFQADAELEEHTDQLQHTTHSDDYDELNVELTPEMIEMFRFSEAFRREVKQEQKQEQIQARQEKARVDSNADNKIVMRSALVSTAIASSNTAHSFGIATLEHYLQARFNVDLSERHPVLWPVLPIDF
ncbi:hypothetical protein BDV3_000486 [Batrachochytrium dendrobatidis]